MEVHRETFGFFLTINPEAVNEVFQASFFLHFASRVEEMPLVRQQPASCWDIVGDAAH
jgi:hypothetical protein